MHALTVAGKPFFRSPRISLPQTISIQVRAYRLCAHCVKKMTVGDNLKLPRILCLHGGGVNSHVFRLQMRAIIGSLSSAFRFVFADGPYASDAHPDIVAVYGDLGPFRRWLRWQETQPTAESQSTAADIVDQCQRVMEEDVGCGPWVGILGFSQGAKIAASLLFAQQGADKARTSFKFGVLMAGSGPMIRLDHRLPHEKHIGEAAVLAREFTDWPLAPRGQHVVKIPTLHVHGLLDPGLESHRRFLDLYFEPKTTRLVEWEGAHRLPIKSCDVQIVVQDILEMAVHAGL